ncbi:hypothetical protein SUGI_0886470 [Cryptomeria japonica]|nr:hypothetical protein SUGI_0886470 [Cryptomeria japonica]
MVEQRNVVKPLSLQMKTNQNYDMGRQGELQEQDSRQGPKNIHLQTQDAIAVSDIPLVVTTAATSTSKALSGDQMLYGYPLCVEASSSAKDILKDAKMWEEDMLNAPNMPEDRERAEVIVTTDPSMVSPSQSIGEASQALPPSRFDHSLEPLKKIVDPRLVDEPSTKPRIAS